VVIFLIYFLFCDFLNNLKKIQYNIIFAQKKSPFNKLTRNQRKKKKHNASMQKHWLDKFGMLDANQPIHYTSQISNHFPL
jgi:hypothetical protein